MLVLLLRRHPISTPSQPESRTHLTFNLYFYLIHSQHSPGSARSSSQDKHVLLVPFLKSIHLLATFFPHSHTVGSFAHMHAKLPYIIDK